MTRPQDRRRAEALQEAMERYERMLADGRTPAEARTEVGGDLGPLTSMFVIAAQLRERADSTIAVPDPAFTAELGRRLRKADVTQLATARSQPRRRPRSRFVPLAAAACVALFAALLVPAMQSLPGDRLYGVKSLSEDARLLFAVGAGEARVRIDLAEERLSEVERLIERARVQALGVFAAGVPEEISDPRLAKLIEDAFEEAGAHLEAAAVILTKQPSDAVGLDELVAISRRGHDLAAKVADDFRANGSRPVLSTVVKLARIEAEAKAARTKVRTEPTPPPCATPTPTPEPTPAATPTATPTMTPPVAPEAATPTAVESPTLQTTAGPRATPCVSPSPSPTPTPTPTLGPDDDRSPEPTGTPEAGGSATDEAEDDRPTGDGQAEQASATDPSQA